VAVRAPVRARGYGAGRRARCRCVAERATALKARVLHARAWNMFKKLLQPFRLAIYLVSGNGSSLRWRCGQCQAAVSLGGAALQAMPGSHFAGGCSTGCVARARCGRLSIIVLRCNFT